MAGCRNPREGEGPETDEQVERAPTVTMVKTSVASGRESGSGTYFGLTNFRRSAPPITKATKTLGQRRRNID